MRRLDFENHQHGAVTALTAAAMVVLMGAAALAVDIGVGWQARRNLVTTTDAAALAAAGGYVIGADGCGVLAPSYVSANGPQATMTACDVSFSGDGGVVTVDATENIPTFFARALGITDFDGSSSSTVQWGRASTATGLRPFGLCADAPGISDFLTNPDVTQTHTISYTKDDPNTCGGNDVPGNWGTIDFDGGANSNADTKDWVENGYDGPVTAGTPSGDCDTEPYACYEGDTGATTGVSKETQDLADSGIFFGLPIYNIARSNGANAEYHIIAFARVRIVDFKFNGAESKRFIELEFERGLITGTCCDPSGSDTNALVLEICAVDRKNLSGC